MNSGTYLSILFLMVVAEILVVLIHNKNGTERIARLRAAYEQERIQGKNRLDALQGEMTRIKNHIAEAKDELALIDPENELN